MVFDFITPQAIEMRNSLRRQSSLVRESDSLRQSSAREYPSVPLS